MYKAPRGTADIMPAEQSYYRYIERSAASLCYLYGYERIDTPVFEDARLFVRSIGSGTDIVEKETYTFEDRSGQPMTLRPEGTASICRAYIEHGMHNLPQPVKLYYFASIFRYERPQKGRYRQHQQFGAEAIGDGDPALDAEVIEMAWQFFQSVGLDGLAIQLNSIGCKLCRPGFLGQLKRYYSTHTDRLCSECKLRLDRNPLRLLDCKNQSCQDIASKAPRSVEHLCSECENHFGKLKDYLRLLMVPFDVNHRLVRGLDYYTKTVFEVQPCGEGGGQSAVGGGGRYDALIEELGGRPTPAVGFAAGMERVVLNIKQRGVMPPQPPGRRVFIAYIGDAAKSEAIKLATQLRRFNIVTVGNFGERSLKAQLRQANALDAAYAVIVGQDEVCSGNVVLRDMLNAEQSVVSMDQLPVVLKEAGAAMSV